MPACEHVSTPIHAGYHLQTIHCMFMIDLFIKQRKCKKINELEQTDKMIVQRGL